MLLSLSFSKISFNPRTYIRYDHGHKDTFRFSLSFNPRTYIRYDLTRTAMHIKLILFQSTYLYKVRPFELCNYSKRGTFQSTYLYKVRLLVLPISVLERMFQSTYLYKVRLLPSSHKSRHVIRFNPRTYIRYDNVFILFSKFFSVSIHVPI